jgi:hypothetical protein
MFYSRSVRRYTSTLAALDTLMNRRISFLSPSTWADRNDRDLMAHYAASTPGRSVFAYCMAEGKETAHHWQVFADRGFGACIVFDMARLVEAVSVDPAVRHGAVAYVNWRELRLTGPSDRLPFIKRQVYRAEREYRLLATPDEDYKGSTYDVPIPLNCITSVYVSGDVPPAHFETFMGIVRSIPDCKSLRLRHSGLLQNPRWAAALSAALNRDANS